MGGSLFKPPESRRSVVVWDATSAYDLDYTEDLSRTPQNRKNNALHRVGGKGIFLLVVLFLRHCSVVKPSLNPTHRYGVLTISFLFPSEFLTTGNTLKLCFHYKTSGKKCQTQ